MKQHQTRTQRIIGALLATGLTVCLWVAVYVVVQIGRQSETAVVALALACLTMLGLFWALVFTVAAIGKWRGVLGQCVS